MSNKKSKPLLSIILFLMLITTAVELPIALAQTKIETTAFAFANPQLLGIGQTVFINAWISPPTGVGNQKYENLTLVITKPDMTTKTINIQETDVGAAVNTNYVVDQVGTWSVKLIWQGDNTHQGAESPPYSWTVQQDPIDFSLPEVPLPTGRWTFPISAQNYEWYQISGPWLTNTYDASQAYFNPFSKGPNTPHILWSKQVVPGGLAGGEQGWNSIQGTFAPNVENNVGLTNYVASQGRLYYATRAFTNNYTSTLIRLHCVNMYTGETIYERLLDWPLAAPSTNPNAFPPGRPNLFLEITGQSKGGSDVRQATVTGAYSLWVTGNGLREIDPMTGDTIYLRKDVSPSVYDDNHFYIWSGGNLTKWNTRSKSDVWSVPGLGNPTYVWNDILVYSQKSYNGFIRTRTYDANTGEMIADGILNNTYSVTLRQCVADGKVFYSCDDLRMYAVDLYTANVAWVSEPMEYPYGAFQAYSQSAAYGIVYSGMVDGHIYAWNTTTGELVWKYYSGNTTTTAYGTWPFWGPIVIADGKLYTSTGEHTTANPMPYGYSLYCLDAFTGEVVWNYPSFCSYTFGSVAMGQGISAGMLWYQNNMDGRLYMFGVGPSETTVTINPKVVPKGTAVLIEGTVTDQSAGSKDTPAISDKDQSAWGQYLYNNAPKPENATGVEVKILLTDPSGDTNWIGTAVTDVMGNFAYATTPQNEGMYKVTAVFDGSYSYYTSSQTTYFVVSSTSANPQPTTQPTQIPPPTQTVAPTQTLAPTATLSPTPAVEPDTGMPIETLLIAGATVIIVIAVIAAALMLRRRK